VPILLYPWRKEKEEPITHPRTGKKGKPIEDISDTIKEMK